MIEYVDLGYRPVKTDLIAEFYIEPSGISLRKAASHVALESSIGTWTEVGTMTGRILRTLKPTVYAIDERTRQVKIAYPVDLFEPGNMPQILSSIAGNIFGMKVLKNLRLEDISFPRALVRSFKGPRHGIPYIRKLTKVAKRPLVGTIVKPKLGLTAKEHAAVAYDAWMGGIDIVKDDENLSSMCFNHFRERIDATVRLKKKAEQETGEKKIYMPNVTAETMEMLRRAEIVKKSGNEYVMIDVITAGWAAVQTLRNNTDRIIHAHRAMHAALTRTKKHGISMNVLAKIARLVGVDQLHIGTVVGKMEGCKLDIGIIEHEIEDDFVDSETRLHVLEQSWYHLLPVFAVCSGGLHPGHTPAIMRILGNNIILQYGGGCHGHPDGTRAGATAIRHPLMR